MGVLIDHMTHLREQLIAAGVPATLDPAQAETTRPCVLVAPPTIDYTTREVTHRLIALPGHNRATLAAMTQLDELVAQVEDAANVEGAEPITYPLAGTGLPAYLIRVTTTH